VCPSYLHMQHLEEGLGKAARRVALGAQDCYHAEGGTHTGAVTAEMLFDFGATWTLVGHSERRRDPRIAESDEAVALKAHHATAVGLSVIACVGESAEERDAGHGIKVITRQLETLAKEVAFWPAVAIAYEPVWAINTGHIASLEHVQEARASRAQSIGVGSHMPDANPQMHEALRGWVRQHVSPTIADSIRILYGGASSHRTSGARKCQHCVYVAHATPTCQRCGCCGCAGSVSMDNCEPLAALPDVDGFLVGGAATRLVYAGSPGVKVRGFPRTCSRPSHGCGAAALGAHAQHAAMRCDALARAPAPPLCFAAAGCAERVCHTRLPRRGRASRRRGRARHGGMRGRRGAARQERPGRMPGA